MYLYEHIFFCPRKKKKKKKIFKNFTRHGAVFAEHGAVSRRLSG
ncbi:hypothetical protein HanPI659440_Chr16g0640771 [Helianthus annuus]|nr:hypothetical protein HanPI659440_Chr16g0640771 [Helianthus annuus]